VIAFWLWQYATETVLGPNAIALYRFGRKVREIKLSDIKSARQSKLFDLSLHLADGSHVRWPLPIGNFAAQQLVEYALTGGLNDRDATASELDLAVHRWTAIREGWQSAVRPGVRYRHIPIGVQDRHHDAMRALACFMMAMFFAGGLLIGSTALRGIILLVGAAFMGIMAKIAVDSLWLCRLFAGEIEFREGLLVLYSPEGARVTIPESALPAATGYLGSLQKVRVDGHRFLIDRTRLVPAPEKASVANVESVPIIRISNY